jgi:methionyl-tRNA synthetase
MNQAKFPLFLSTAIPYVNASPHVGHAFELVVADALGRHARQRGRPVLLTGGSDDHSLKNARAAERLGVPTHRFVAESADVFRRLPELLDVTLDEYVHTSRDARHTPAVIALWQRCKDAGDLYQREYSGLYCTGCEAFLQESDLLAGRCPQHREPPEPVRETNWFFRLSKYETAILERLESGALRIEPLERHNEVVAFVRSGLRDFSVSRSRERARGWGISVPSDASQVIYVWFDALTNYLTSLGFPQQTPEFERHFATASEREHLIGKDVLRFHAVYWPALLLSAGLSPPTSVKVHGFVTVDGEKIGKSLGNAIDPFALLERYGVDAVRYYLLRHLHTSRDSDFRAARLIEAHDTEIVGKLGNLLQRTTALAARHPTLNVSCQKPTAAESELVQAAQRTLRDSVRAVDEFALHRALASIFAFVSAANRYADTTDPWKLSRKLLAGSEARPDDAPAQLGNVLWHLLEALRVSAVLLAPYVPRTSRQIAARLAIPELQLEDLSWARFGRWPRFFAENGSPPFRPLRARLPQS